MSKEDMDELEKKIYDKLIEHEERCDLHEALGRALYPFILVNPEQKARDLAHLIKEEWEV